jgi:ElaB/YqjD/DUF883 family membrane-anchored ribosome-binding protein
MANETEVIREKMEATRTDLSDKLEKLEKQVVDTVQEATSTVADAVHGAKEMVDSVKDTVEGAMDSVKGTMDNVTGAVGDAVDGVKDTFEGAAEGVRHTFEGAADAVRNAFDLPKQVDHHPWLMMGGAVAVGFVAGKLLDHAPAVARYVGQAAQASGHMAESALSAAGSAASSAASTTGGLLGSLERMFGPEMGRIKELALGALGGVIRDVVIQAAPESMSRQLREILDSFTSKLGGKPVEGAVLGPRPSEEGTANGPNRRF